MPTITEGSIHIFSYKEGVLSKLGHDLRFSAKRFQIDIQDDRSFVVTLFLKDLELDGAMIHGSLSPSTLSAKDQREIRETCQSKVLNTARFDTAKVAGNVAGDLESGTATLKGSLELNGNKKSISFNISKKENRIVGATSITPSEWGIQPYRALMGTLKIQDRVDVRFDLPDPFTES